MTQIYFYINIKQKYGNNFYDIEKNIPFIKNIKFKFWKNYK